MNDFRKISELYHHGIKGQKWGVRRFQNPDGTLTEEGNKRFNEQAQKLTDIATAMAELEDLTRQYDLRNANSKVLVPKEDAKLWEDAYQLSLKLYKKYDKDKIGTRIVTLEDGTDYVVSRLDDKKLDGVVEYYEPLLYDSNGKKYTQKNRLYNTTKSYNQQLGHSDELMHYGIKGQKWGIRRFENEDGTLTKAGRDRYEVGADGKMSKYGQKLLSRDKQLEEYRMKQLNPREAEIASLQNRYSKDLQKYDSKIANAKEKNNEKKAEKLEYKKSLTKAKQNYELGIRFLERDNIRNASFEELKKRYDQEKMAKVAVYGVHDARDWSQASSERVKIVSDYKNSVTKIKQNYKNSKNNR